MNSTYSIDVQSIGTAGPEVHRALTRVMTLSQQEIVARLYRAPSELLAHLEEDTARDIAKVLTSTGLDVRVRPTDEPLTSGVGEFDIAIHLKEPARIPEIARELAVFLGCDLPKAAALSWASPAQVIGSVSQATVDALRARLEPLGVELDVSRSHEAHFDLYIGECAPSIRHRAGLLVQSEGAEVHQDGPLLAMGLSREATERLWAQFKASSVPITALNRDFQRFDIRLDRGTDTPELRALLVDVTGMPEALVPKVLKRLPLHLVQGVRSHDVPAILERFAPLDASVSAHLLAFRSFDIEVLRVTDLHKTADTLGDLTDTASSNWHPKLAQPCRVEGPFPQTRALWMRHELQQIGCKVALHER